MSKKYFFAFDTSNYTTSFAVCDGSGKIVLNFKKLLEVKEGERGLRQSDAVFLHVKNSELITREISSFVSSHPDFVLEAVGVSVRPRDVQDSYMPCFLVGKSLASTAAASLAVPVYEFSHQSGHVAAALYGAGATSLIGKDFVAFHVSGGTTEVLLVSGYEKGAFKIERIGGTLDLNAGQVIDRVGVMLGIPFPCGAHLEKLALGYAGKSPKYPNAVNFLNCNLSGIENKAKALFESEKNINLTAAFTISAVSDVIAKLTENVLTRYPGIPIVYSGGVMSCSVIRKRLEDKDRYFAPPEFSSDNAAGIAYLTMLENTK
ncbi:MAG: peptidase M22 [Clostridia bacterium]|nr:peptidase M22 [Clostridia bacterium]